MEPTESSTPPPLDYAPPPAGRSAFAAVVSLLAHERVRRLLKRLSVITVLFVVCGYVSNRVSVGACERRTAKWVATGPLQGRAFAVGGRIAGGAESLAIFREAGVTTATAAAPATTGATFPWGEVRHGRGWLPFVVDVEYGWCAQPLVGEGGDVRYVCFFGFVLETGKRTRWVT